MTEHAQILSYDVRHSPRHIPPAPHKVKLQIELQVFALLLKGGRYTAKQISEILRTKGYVWEALLQMERDALVYRAAVYEDWRTFNSWKITGCGILFDACPR